MKSTPIFILLFMSLVIAIGCDKKDAPAVEEKPVTEEPVVEEPIVEEPVVEEPVVEEPVVEEPLPNDAVPPIIRPPIEGASASVSIDSIRTLFVGEWKQIARFANAERPLDVQADTLIFYSDGRYTRNFQNPTIETFYQVDSAVLHTRYHYNDESLNAHGLSYRFYDDKLRLEYVEGWLEKTYDTESIMVYRRIK
jgi:hypothetical protein